MPRDDDLYALLGVTRAADAEEIRLAYRRAAKRAHPDRGGSSEAFQRVRRAAETLIAEAEARAAGAPAGDYLSGDRLSAPGDWPSAFAALAARWGRTPTVLFAPQKIGLSPFAAGGEINVAAYRWMLRAFGPRGADWDFHSEGELARICFRLGDDAKRFQIRFV